MRRALLEDLGRAGDVTTDAIVPAGPRRPGGGRGARGGPRGRPRAGAPRVPAARPGVPGRRPAAPTAATPRRATTIARVERPARALLTAERTALNLLGHLSGIATATRDVVARLDGLKTRVVCTRKTTPGLRALEKYAVRVGGGSSHRYGLDDAVLVKDNHVALAGGIAEAVAARRGGASGTW